MDRKRRETSAIENLDEAITVVGVKGWTFLAASLVLFIPLILWAFLGTIPIAVSGKCLLFNPSVSGPSSGSGNLEIYGFLPLFAAQRIQVGMEVECALDAIDTSQAGMLKGVVKEIFPFPVDLAESHMEQIPSQSLKEYLLSGSSVPLILVIAEPLADSKVSAEYSWTYKNAPHIPLQSGMTGTVTITLSRERPISYIIPPLSNASSKK